jgi:hypothetical protein
LQIVKREQRLNLMQIVALNSRLKKIYKPDVIPFRFLCTRSAMEFLVAFLKFRDSAIGEGPEIIFQAGTFVIENQSPIVVNGLSINDRRVVIDVAGPTEGAEAVAVALRDLFKKIEPAQEFASSDPLITTHDTECVAAMDFEWSQLVSDTVAEFAMGPALRAAEGKNTARIATLALKFTIAFTASDPGLIENGVTLSDKLLTIEPRSNTPLKDRLFFTSSPLDTESHMRLFSELEKKLSGRGKRRALPSVK